MRKDFKTGLFTGLVLVSIFMVWLSFKSGPQGSNPSAASTNSEQERPFVPGSVVNEAVPVTSGEPAVKVSPPKQRVEAKQVPALSVHEKDEVIKTQRFHIVSPNETLWSISTEYYGTAAKWSKIHQANSDIIKNPDKLTAGMKLVIPK